MPTPLWPEILSRLPADTFFPLQNATIRFGWPHGICPSPVPFSGCDPVSGLPSASCRREAQLSATETKSTDSGSPSGSSGRKQRMGVLPEC